MRVVTFEVSMNGGQDWVSNTGATSTYTFKEVPYLLTLSHYEAPMTGDFLLTITGHAIESNIQTCMFGRAQYPSALTAPGKFSPPISLDFFLAVFVDAQTVTCWVPNSRDVAKL